MWSALRQRRKDFYQRWLERRLPAAKSITLTQRRIFILPSRPGLYFLLVLMVMLMAAINYENNMAFALTFFLFSLFVVSILHTYANLSGLILSAGKAGEGFVGDAIDFQFTLSAANKRRYFDVWVGWPKGSGQLLSLTASRQCPFYLSLTAMHRGVVHPGRILVASTYPLGLLRAWSWVTLETAGLAYPRPLPIALPAGDDGNNNDGELPQIIGSDEFFCFDRYQPGDPQKHIFWRGYAKGQPLQTRQYQSFQDRQIWLDWQRFPGHIEQRLSYLCYWALEFESGADSYGLRLPSTEIAPGRGSHHLQRVLRALASFEAKTP